MIDIRDIGKEETTNSLENQLFEFSKDLVEDWFTKGKGLRSTPLKNYTSGDKKKGKIGKHIGFEGVTEKIINKGLSLYNLSDRSTVDGEYFKDPEKIMDKQRMDNHIWIDGKVVIVEENRAWMDKPFYILKRAVLLSFMTLSHTREHLDDDVVFIFSTLATDVTNITRSTLDTIFGHGERIVESNFSGLRREYPKYNYFDRGVDLSELRKYVKTLSDVFVKYA